VAQSLVKPIAGEAKRTRVTFLWRATRLADTDVWDKQNTASTYHVTTDNASPQPRLLGAVVRMSRP
jgi:hypothetical protein